VPDLRSVPDETKWRIATEYSSRMAEISERILRPFLKDRYDELEQEIEIEMAQFSYELARSLKLPVETARELAESLSLVRSIVFGPDSREEVIEVGKNGAVIIIRHCPFLRGGSSSGDGIFRRCMAFTLASQKQMNTEHSSRFVRAMCMGDRQCEIKIEPEKKSRPAESAKPE